MTNLTEKAKRWPRTRSGEVLFKTTHEAIIYAHLIYDNKRLVEEIKNSLYAARDEIAIHHGHSDPNLDLLMQIAVKAQMFRECLEEVVSIMVEQPEGRE